MIFKQQILKIYSNKDQRFLYLFIIIFLHDFKYSQSSNFLFNGIKNMFLENVPSAIENILFTFH